MSIPVPLTNRSHIQAYLETDRLYAAYAIGDLEPGLFELCEWTGSVVDDRLDALALHYHGLEPPALFVMGSVSGLRAILGQASGPRRVYLTCREERLSVTREFYAWEQVIPMFRMVLPPASFSPVEGHCLRLGTKHAEQLVALYALGGGAVAFSPSQIAGGVFYGASADGQLVAAAGTHLVSPTYGVAAVGNVFTHPEYRGRGYGSATTTAVVAELLALEIRDVVLNVGQENDRAISIYERLGFERYCPFLEGPASIRRF
jgi:GNAT superfamily N-acetyltransferase